MHCAIQLLAVVSGAVFCPKYGYWFAVIGIEMQEMKVHEFFEICILLPFGWHFDSNLGVQSLVQIVF